jgi:hypothetical protein
VKTLFSSTLFAFKARLRRALIEFDCCEDDNCNRLCSLLNVCLLYGLSYLISGAHSLTVAPMRGIYLHLKYVLQCIRLFYIKKIKDDAFHVLNFHFSLTLALGLSFLFSKF